jgi:hypothetical protein
MVCHFVGSSLRAYTVERQQLVTAFVSVLCKWLAAVKFIAFRKTVHLLLCPTSTLSAKARSSESHHYAFLTDRAFGVSKLRFPHRQGLRSPNTTLSSQRGSSEFQYYAFLTDRAFEVPILRCHHREGLRSPNTTLSSQAGPSESQYYALLTGWAFGVPILGQHKPYS